MISWRDARDDAANARVATYLATSIDGGQTFSPETFANPDDTAINSITNQTQVLGPLPDNQSGGDTQRDSTFGFGSQMGLAVSDGHVFPVWAGNFNQGFYNATTNAIEADPLNIWYRPMVIAAGPRIINSTMGPIPLAEAASGTVTISVTFDRPVNPATFVTGDVQVFYHDTVNGDASIPLLVTGVNPVASSGSGPGNSFGYTQFTVTFNPSKNSGGAASNITDYTGTYSYLIAPDNGSGKSIGSPIWAIVNGAFRTEDPMDQNADGTSDQNAVTTPFTGVTPGDVYATPMPQPATAIVFSGASSILSPPFNQNTLPLIVAGSQVLSTSVPNGNSAEGNLIVNGTTSTMNVSFDRPMQVSTFTPADVLQIMGPTGSILAPQFFPSNNLGQTIPAATLTASTLDSLLTVPNFNGSFKIADITVQLTAAFAPDSALTVVLIAPDGTPIQLFANVGGNGANFVNTVFDDSALNSIAGGAAPFTGTFKPAGTLSSLDGKEADGVWKLEITNSSTGTAGILDNWSLNITPAVTVTPVSPQSVTINGHAVQVASTFTVGFPQQQLSGTYTVQLDSSILDEFNHAVDTNQNAGLAVLRDQGQNSPTTTVQFAATDTPKAITGGQLSSTITVPSKFLVQGDTTTSGISGLRVQLNVSDANDPNLSATLYYEMGTASEVAVPLFSAVGKGTNTANFTNTLVDDNAPTPIQNGNAPFFGTFNPQSPLSAFEGVNAQGAWTLVITSTGGTATLNGWSLSFQKPLPTSGLGEPGSDNISASFRIFTLGQADALSSQAWTAVGPAAISGASGQVSAIAVDPSDPSGNTVYVTAASGGIWKTTNFLTTNPNGPTWIPLTDFGPTSGLYINSITVFSRNSNPNDSIIIAATGSTTGGEGHTITPGVGFLISDDGGATWNLYDSSSNVDASGNLLPIESAARNREFIGMTANKVVVDPKLTPSGQVIIYAAMSGTNGGIWRSEDTGKTWMLMLAGNATDVILDQDSGTLLDPDTDTNVVGNLQVVFAGMEGQGVFISPNQGQVWTLMAGGNGNPLIVDNETTGRKNVNPLANPSPNGAQGRIVLAVPAPTESAVQNAIYAGWLYAAVSTASGDFDGLFVTKDFGQNWTKVSLNTLPPINNNHQAIPTNDVTQQAYPITYLNQGNLYLSLVADPTNPNIVYLGSAGGDNLLSDTGLIRVDTTNMWDAHSLVAYDNFAADGGLIEQNTKGPAQIDAINVAPPLWEDANTFAAETASYLNFIRNPDAPFVANATLEVYDYASFTNNGAGVTWMPFDMPGTNYQSAVAVADPTTGLPRLIFGNSQGVWSVLDNNGTLETEIGTEQTPGVNRNGNLQITQFYYGAAQPSNAAAQVAHALSLRAPPRTTADRSPARQHLEHGQSPVGSACRPRRHELGSQ